MSWCNRIKVVANTPCRILSRENVLVGTLKNKNSFVRIFIKKGAYHFRAGGG